MARLFINEFEHMGSASFSLGPMAAAVQCAQAPPVGSQCIEFAELIAEKSKPFSEKTRFIRVHTDAVCSIAFNAVATVSDCRLVADQTEFFGVGPGVTLSVVANT